MVLISTWKLVVLERYAKFDGRASRSEYWWFFLANLIVFGILFLLAFNLPTAGLIAAVVMVLYWAAMIVPTIAVGVRRLHDSNKTGWLMLLALFPILNWVLLILMILGGDENANQYGEPADPIS